MSPLLRPRVAARGALAESVQYRHSLLQCSQELENLFSSIGKFVAHCSPLVALQKKARDSKTTNVLSSRFVVDLEARGNFLDRLLRGAMNHIEKLNASVIRKSPCNSFQQLVIHTVYYISYSNVLENIRISWGFGYLVAL